MAKKKTKQEAILEHVNDIVEQEANEVAAVKTVAKKKGLSSFGSMLKAANAKRKERNKQYGKEN